MRVEQPLTIDLLDIAAPSLSATSDIPVIETKPDSVAAPEVKAEAKPEAKPDTNPAVEEPKAKEEIAAPAKEPEGKKPEESAPPEDPDEDPAANAEPAKKPAKGVQKRIDELVRQREEEKAEKLRLLAIVEGLNKPKTEQPKEVAIEDQEPQRPVRESFGTTEEYVAAVADYAEAKASWSAKQAVAADRAAQQKIAEQRAIEEGQRATREAYAKRVEKAVEEYPDYKEVAESPNVMVSVPMAHAIMTSEQGPKLAYFLGKNPAEAQRIAQLPPPVQLMEMGLLAGRLSVPAAKAEEPAPAPQQKPAVSAAPKPIKPLESKGEPPTKDPSLMNMDEYAAFRKREQAAGRGGART